MAELALFGVAALGVVWVGINWAGDPSEALILLLVAATFFVIAMLPMPWRRSISVVAIGAFVGSLIVFGWIDWALVFFHEPEWSELPIALFSWQNIGIASVLCAAAAAGRAMSAPFSKM